MMPDSFIEDDLVTTDEPETSRTYKTMPDRIQGFTDELAALQQAIYKVLDTDRYEYAIYSGDYGIDLISLIGKDREYVRVELKRRIQECLLADERIERVDSFNITFTGDELTCSFAVTSIYGELLITKEVNT